MPPSAKELEEIADNLVRRLEQRVEGRIEALLREYVLLRLAGRILVILLRLGMYLGGITSAFAVGTLLLNKWTGGQLSLEGLMLGGLLSVSLFWLFVMRRYPILAQLVSMGTLFWILSRGGV